MPDNNLQNASSVLKRIKVAYNLNSYGELAEYLGVSPGTISAWKTRDTLNYKLILDRCSDLDFDTLFFSDKTPDTKINTLLPDSAFCGSGNLPRSVLFEFKGLCRWSISFQDRWKQLHDQIPCSDFFPQQVLCRKTNGSGSLKFICSFSDRRLYESNAVRR